MWLGARPVDVLFRDGHLSQVTGVVLADRRRVVVKVRPGHPRLAGCAYVHERLWRVGFPCPEPLVGPVPFDGGGVRGVVGSAEAYLTDGDVLAADVPGAVDAYAGLLARLIRLAPQVAGIMSMTPGPAWTAWDHAGPGVWPAADDRPDDLNAIPETAWLDDIGAAVQRRLTDYGTVRTVVGHGDFEAQN